MTWYFKGRKIEESALEEAFYNESLRVAKRILGDYPDDDTMIEQTCRQHAKNLYNEVIISRPAFPGRPLFGFTLIYEGDRPQSKGLCPYCNGDATAHAQTVPAVDGSEVRERYKCLNCNKHFVELNTKEV